MTNLDQTLSNSYFRLFSLRQCYKFETQTDMERAEEFDLQQASQQGTILEIWVDGQRYGRGGFHPHFIWPQWATVLLSCLGGMGLVGCLTLLCRKFGSSAMVGTVLQWLRERFFRTGLPSSFKEHFHIEDEEPRTTVVDDLEEDDIDVVPLSYVY